METTTAETLINGADAGPVPAQHEAGTDDAIRLSWPHINHTLAYPLTLPDGAKVSVIVVSEPDLETLERVAEAVEALGLTDDSKIGVKHLRPIIAALTGIPSAALGHLHYKDANALAEAIYPLLIGLMT